MRAYAIYHGMDDKQENPAGVAIFNDDGVLDRLDGTDGMFQEALKPEPFTPAEFVSRYRNWHLVPQGDV